MNSNSRSRLLRWSGLTAATLTAAVSLSACAQQSHWQQLYVQGKQAELAHNFDVAEKKYRDAITDGEEHRVPEKFYGRAIADLGRVLLKQGREGEAINYLVRALQLGGATNMSLAENCELLHKLAHAEAATEDWEEATGTEKSLITLLEVEKSPYTPELVDENKFYSELKVKLAEYRKEHPQVAEGDQKTQ